jgi:hypothetical protein
LAHPRLPPRRPAGANEGIAAFVQDDAHGATVPLLYENRPPELQFVNPDLNEEICNLIEAADLDPEQEVKLERESIRQYHILIRQDLTGRLPDGQRAFNQEFVLCDPLSGHLSVPAASPDPKASAVVLCSNCPTPPNPVRYTTRLHDTAGLSARLDLLFRPT